MSGRNIWIRIWTSISIVATLTLGLLPGISVPAIHAATSTVIDDFETGDYTGGAGWTGNWVEVNDSGTSQSPTSGDIRIVSDGGSQRLRVKDDSRGAYRLADLSGASAAFLTFEYRRGNLNSANDYVLVQLSSSGASGPWTEVGRIEGSGSDASYIQIGFDITSHISTQTAVRFFSSPSLGNDEPIFFDNVEIIHSDTLGDFCYLVADDGGGNGGDDWMTFIVKSSGVERPIGTGTGTNTIEAIAYWPGTGTLYAADADELGTLDPTTGEYTTIGGFGSGGGSLGTISFSDVDSLSFDPFSGILYGVHRRSGANEEDVLIQIDTGTGQHITDAFGTGVDYVVINAGAVTGYYDIDDIAISSADGTMHAIANNGGSGDRLIVVDKTNGSVSDVGALGVNDMEGFSYDTQGNLFGSSGTGDSSGEGLYDISVGTGAASNRRALNVGSDYEAAACLLASDINTVTGTVFYDINSDGSMNGGDSGVPGITVRLYRDENGDGSVDGGDTLVATLETDANGEYNFPVAALGDFVLDIDTGDLPSGATMTTDNVEAASFAGFGNADTGNDFGYNLALPDLSIAKADAVDPVLLGAPFDYTLDVINAGSGATGVVVTDTLPTELGFVSVSSSQGGCFESVGTVVCDLGSLASGDSATITVTVVATFTGTHTNNAEVAANEAEADTGNNSASESTTVSALPTDVCYAVADGGNQLVIIDCSAGTSVAAPNPLGVSDVEAIAYWAGTGTLYAADAGDLGIVNTTTGIYYRIGSFGSGDGALGTIDFDDVDGLTFDPFTGILYGTQRESGNDLLIQINPATGAVVQDAFGAGVDYVVVPPVASGLTSLDDIAVSSSDGQMYGTQNNSSGVDDHLISINKSTGASSDVGRLNDGTNDVDDMEGLGYDAQGNLYGTTGTASAAGYQNRFYSVDETNALVAILGDLSSHGTDYEGVDCLTDGINTISGSVFQDEDGDGNYDPEDTGTSGVTVRLYRDTNGDGTVDGGDVLLATQDTDGDGYYSFSVVADGDFVLEIDASDLPGGHTFTTDNAEDAGFVSFGNLDGSNNFGHASPTAVTLASFTAGWDDGEVLVAWETALEIDTVGFNLWRSTALDGEYERVNATLIPAASLGGAWGGSYTYADAGVTPGTTYYYKLEELEVSGARNWHGPVSTGVEAPTDVTISSCAVKNPSSPAFIFWLVVMVVGASGLALTRLRKSR